jgi:hypothetical protein
MRHCFDCGAEIRDVGFRRVVETGRSRRVYSGTRRTSVSRSTSEGLRTLCASCVESRDRRAAFEAKVMLVLICGAAVLLGIAYMSHSTKTQESASVVHLDGPAASSNEQDSHEPTETASITPPAAPANEEVVVPRIAPPTPLIGGDPSLLDPNFPPNAERVQDRLRSLGFSVNDPRGVWSKSTDSAVRRFRKSHGLRSDWRWDFSTQTALFVQAR